MKKNSKMTLCIGIALTIGVILGHNIPKQNFSSSNNPKRQTIAMYLENEDGGYDLSSQSKFPTDGYVLNTEKSSCKNGGTLSQDPTTKKLSLSVSSSDQCNVYFDKIKLSLTPESILTKFGKTSQGTRTYFDTPAKTDEGIFEMEDDYGTSYYYRGAVEDNYVKYGVNKDGHEMWWRIIRINGNGSVRIIYDGTQGHANGTEDDDRFIKRNQPFNEKAIRDNKYHGWMYSPAGATASTSKEEAQTNTIDSDIKKVVDTWYKENIVDTGYSKNVSDVIFCNDRSTPGKELTEWSYDTGKGYGGYDTAYGATARSGFSNLSSSKKTAKPSFVCPKKNDAFTVNDIENGNGALTYPIGLMTADEAIAAGSGKYGGSSSETKYFFKGVLWLLSPCFAMSQHFVKYNLNSTGVESTGDVAPVINLTPEYASTMIGSGTITDPYRAA